MILLPVLIPIFAAAVCLIFWNQVKLQRIISGITSHLLLVVAGFLLRSASTGRIDVMHMGSWGDGLGIVYYLDVFSALMICMSSMIVTITWWFSFKAAEEPADQHLFYHPLLLLITAGVNWAFLTGDLFNLFVSFELILLATYVLLTDPSKLTSLREAYKFLIVNGVAGTMFLMAAGLIYGYYGTLNLAELSIRVSSEEISHGPIYGSMLLIVFGLKAAIFPLFTWLPSSYPNIPLAILPFLTALLTKVGVYALYRIYPLVFMESGQFWFQPLLMSIAAITMLVGVFSALSQWTIRGILSIHIVSQIGYMIFGLALLTPLGLTGGMMSILHNIIVKTALFLVAGTVVLAYGTDKLKELGGVMSKRPFLASLFFIAAISLAGLPPSSGFFSKWILTFEGIATGHSLTAAAAVITGLFTLASMVKIFLYVFWGDHPKEAVASNSSIRGGVIVTAALVAVSIGFVVLSGPITELSSQAAEQLLDRQAYREAVLGPELLIEQPTMASVEVSE